MNFEDFHLTHIETIDNSIIKQKFLETYHQQAAT